MNTQCNENVRPKLRGADADPGQTVHVAVRSRSGFGAALHVHDEG